MEIRTATTADVETLVPLFDGYRVFYREDSDLDGARAFLSARLERRDSEIFVALDEGGAGLGFVQLFPSFSSVSMKDLWILNDLFVAHEARGKGVARALMDRARRLAVESGAKGLILETESDNVPAKRLYEDLGWTIDGTDHYQLLV